MNTFEEYRLGINDDDITISSSEEHYLAARLMVQQSRREISIISRNLDPHVYDHPDFVDAIKTTLLSNRRGRVRILVIDSQAIVRRGHLLLNLAANLPSFIHFRKPGIEYKDFNESLFVADKTGYVYRNSAERFDGNLNFNDPRKSKILMDVFEEMWERSSPDPNMRLLTL